jgi:cytochrome c
MKNVVKMALAATALVAFAGAAQAGDVEAGKTVFKKCMACHKAEAGKNGVGPSLFGVVGRKAGSEAGFKYSPAMTAKGVTWDAANIDAYLKDPKGFVPGNKMAFAGLPKDEDRANVIAYLETVK